MKQRISAAQLMELTPEQQEKLREWWKKNLQHGDVFICEGMTLVVTDPRGSRHVLACSINDSDAECDFYHLENCLPLVSIGQCIQLLEEAGRFKGFHKSSTDGRYKVYNENELHDMVIHDALELIDALFEAIKSIL